MEEENRLDPRTGALIAGLLATVGAFGIGAGIALGNWYGWGLCGSSIVFTAMQIGSFVGHALNVED